nr:hypothetical protein [uncultured Methanolobus sp.]
MNNNRTRIASLLMTMLILSMAFIPAVSAKADTYKNAKDIITVDLSNKTPYSMGDINELNNYNIIKETDNERILSCEDEDGTVKYIMTYADDNYPDRVYFSVITEDELASSDLVSDTLSADSSSISAVILSSTSFCHGSYVEPYGNSITGGVYIYLAPVDASALATVSSIVLGGLTAALTVELGPVTAGVVGTFVAAGVYTFYWYEANNDGSLDVQVPYANIVSISLASTVIMKIGDHWYSIDI